jgi:hypothetical protein
VVPSALGLGPLVYEGAREPHQGEARRLGSI